ncbi:hypothetical protein KL86PLE_130643 [uncultured Pleomorphomonas sp.]|uniref:Uncharacterized protein n=1 Tax=uncultured Pleomorphomonas sp. TaxID=442121 RepID=A0A212LCF2_9HYPH|nr:hypothetical protein KL86PLE_130643 [uncultured Pleomorphomonas sp.]
MRSEAANALFFPLESNRDPSDDLRRPRGSSSQLPELGPDQEPLAIVASRPPGGSRPRPAGRRLPALPGRRGRL